MTIDLDEAVFQYTEEFSRQAGLELDPAELREGICRHMASARAVVTDRTLKKICHLQLALMINTAARFGVSLGEVLMEALRLGSRPVAEVCNTLANRKTSARPAPRKPNLRLV